MDIDIITQYILAIVPAFTAVVGMVVTLGVGIGKIKKANSEALTTVNKVDKRQESLEAQLRDVHKENVELKRELRKLMAKIEHIHFIEDDNKEE